MIEIEREREIFDCWSASDSSSASSHARLSALQPIVTPGRLNYSLLGCPAACPPFPLPSAFSAPPLPGTPDRCSDVRPSTDSQSVTVEGAPGSRWAAPRMASRCGPGATSGTVPRTPGRGSPPGPSRCTEAPRPRRPPRATPWPRRLCYTHFIKLISLITFYPYVHTYYTYRYMLHLFIQTNHVTTIYVVCVDTWPRPTTRPRWSCSTATATARPSRRCERRWRCRRRSRSSPTIWAWSSAA